ncbi:C40 family peptidase [Neobacillus mesonae]|nr:C40 family peptidase [Neobacillus mesonae]
MTRTESGEKRMTVSVPVATVWTTPKSPREMDLKILHNPADIGAWVNQLATEERLDLCASNRTQTQVLYASEVVVHELDDGWANIRIPSQPSLKDPRGYPGWIPSVQLSEWNNKSVKKVQVRAKYAVMNLLEAGAAERESLELSYLTSLPLIEEKGARVFVESPHGVGVLNRKDVILIHDSVLSESSTVGNIGGYIVEEANRFLDLPYLWGGLSAYGYDCSGFANSMYASQGIMIPRDASDQALAGTEVASNELQPGDLLFFAYEEGKGRIHHVGIYIGDGKMIHSPDSKSRIEVVELATYKLIKEHCRSRRYY